MAQQRVVLAALTVALSVALAIVINVATGGTLPSFLEPYRRWSWPVIAALAIGTVALAAWDIATAHRGQGPGSGPAARQDAGGSGATPSDHADRVPPAPSAELPADIATFTGRPQELRRLRDLLVHEPGDDRARNAPIAVIAGKPGVGKTTLALHVAHRLRDRYPDGQLYVNLRGTEPGSLDVASVLAELLRTLGIAGHRIPQTVDDRSRLYRHLLSARRMLVLLDNAATEAQVRPLLPGASASSVLITSRSRLSSLEAATVELDVLTPKEATELLGKLAGPERTNAEPDAAHQIVQLCGYLPLAIRIAGAKLAARPHWRLARLATRLSAERGRLAELRAGDLDVRASFVLSYQDQEMAEQGAFRLLGLLNGPDFPAWVATTLLQGPPAADEEVLERLVEAQLLEAAGEDALGQLRYRFHDLLRAFARERLHAEVPPATQKVALERTLHGYATRATQAAELLRPTGRPPTTSNADFLPDRQAALRWFDIERANLQAAVDQAAAEDLLATVCDLVRALDVYFPIYARWLDLEATSRVLLAASRRLSDRSAEAKALDDLGVSYREQRRVKEALAYYEESLAITIQVGDQEGESRALHHLGIAWRDLWLEERDPHQLTLAIKSFERSLAIARETGDRFAEARPLEGLGVTLQLAGRFDEALYCFAESMRIRRELNDRYGEGITINNIANLYLAQQRYPEAVAGFEQSLAIKREVGDRYGEGLALMCLGKAMLEWQGLTVVC
jgi:tetratricopeptide (TPR) repeat protein